MTSKINRVHPLIMVNMSSKFDKEICNGVDSIAFTRSTHGQTDGTTEPQQRCAGISLYCVHKLISIDVHCDLDLWPLTSKINRVHPLIMVNMSSKFDKEICNGVDSIAFTRSTHRQTDGTTEPQQRCAGIIKRCAGISLYCVHKLISIDVHCDLDLWPLTSKINRVYPLIMVNMSSKFDKEICNGVDSIAFTRSSHGQTDGTTAALRGDN